MHDKKRPTTIPKCWMYFLVPREGLNFPSLLPRTSGLKTFLYPETCSEEGEEGKGGAFYYSFLSTSVGEKLRRGSFHREGGRG